MILKSNGYNSYQSNHQIIKSILSSSDNLTQINLKINEYNSKHQEHNAKVQQPWLPLIFKWDQLHLTKLMARTDALFWFGTITQQSGIKCRIFYNYLSLHHQVQPAPFQLIASARRTEYLGEEIFRTYSQEQS